MSSKPSKQSKAERLLGLSVAESVTQPPVASPMVPRAPNQDADDCKKVEFRFYKPQSDALNELSLFIASHGRQVNRQRLIRCAILSVKADPAFLAIYDEASESDKDRIRH